jgi:hypothetical protein
MRNRYIITSGYWAAKNDTFKANFHRVWHENTVKHTKPEEIFIINHASECMPVDRFDDPSLGVYQEHWLNMTYNPGHNSSLPRGNSNSASHICGWTQAFLIGCQLAYGCGCDLLFKEQDCLIIGDGLIEKAYETLGVTGGGRGFCCGARAYAWGQPLEQSLVLVAYEDTLDFIKAYMEVKGSDNETSPEKKFFDIGRNRKIMPMSFLPFGIGRRKWQMDLRKVPVPFYLQQINQGDLNLLEGMKLL